MPTKKEDNCSPTKLYNQIEKAMPITSVKATIQIDNILGFLKRNNQPTKEKGRVPEGRIKKDKTLQEAHREKKKKKQDLHRKQTQLINV